MKKFRILLLSLLTSLLFFGCEVGLGEEVDLESPVIKIINPANLSKVHLEFLLEGTATDNQGVTRVEISNKDTGFIYGNATLDGENWSFPMKLTKEDEGDITFKVEAFDLAQNQSPKSYKTFTLSVDDTPPESEDWYIDRGKGVTIRLNTLEYLKALNTDLSENKDIPQNQSFSIHGKVKDGTGIGLVKVTLKNEKGKEIISKISEGSYTPIIEFTHEDLVKADPALATGKHYLQVSFVCQDEHENNYSETLDWLLWYPESDLPRINEKEEIRINIQNPISVDYFDDDQIGEVRIALKMENSPQLEGVTVKDLIENETIRNAIFDEANRKKENTDDSKIEHIYIEKPNSLRESTYSIKSTELLVAANMKLIVCLKDINGLWNAYITPVTIADSELPQLIINSPAENTTPSVVANTNNIKIDGYALDKRSKPGKVYSIFVKDSVADKVGITNKIIMELTGTDDEYTAKYGETARTISAENIAKIKKDANGTIAFQNGTVKWQSTIKDSTYTDSSQEGWKKNTFAFTYDLIDELGEEGKNPKYYTLLYVDANGMKTTKLLPLNGDQTPPKITIVAKAKNGEGDRLLKAMNSVNPENDELTITFDGVKDTGLGMKEDSYKIKIGETVVANGKSITYNKEQLKELQKKFTQPTFICEAEDKLGNKNSDQITLVLSNLPRVTSITSDNQSGTYKTGDKLVFLVNFDSEVKITGAPKLNVGINTDTKKADLFSGTNTKSLWFEYTVESNITCNKVEIPNVYYIDLNGGTIENDGIADGPAKLDDVTDNNLVGTVLKIDSVSPTFSDITYTSTVTENDDKKYVKAGDIITAVLTASENILVTGAPTLVLKGGAIGTSDLQFTFQGVDNNKLTFIHKVTSSTPNGVVALNGTSYFTNADKSKITDEVGNVCGNLTALSKNACDTIQIDTVAPGVPTLKLASGGTEIALSDASDLLNKAQTLKFYDLETGATVYYSVNGGSSWKLVTAEQKTSGVILPEGEISVTAKQVDIAGNESNIPTEKKLNIQPRFPTVISVNIANSDGYVKQGEKIIFNVYFDDIVKLTTADAKLQFTDSTNGNEREINFKTTSGDGAKLLTAEYTVQSTDVIDGIRVKEITNGSITDKYGNVPGVNPLSAYLKADYGWRDGIKVDGIKPTLSTTTPVNNGVQTTGSDNFTIELTFSEPVYTESGYVTLQRIGATGYEGDWAIPPVLSNEDFVNIYNQLGTTDRETLMRTNNGAGNITDEKLQDYTARPLGPYMKYTHGIKADGSPDQTTKFVLAPEYGLYGTTGTVANIRNVLAKTGYHQHKVDIKSNQVSGNGTNIIRIEFSEKIPDGQHWALLIDNTCIRDSAQNFYDGISDVTGYNLWSQKVATPVIRVDRYSHNIGAKEPKLNAVPANRWQIVSNANVDQKDYVQEITAWTENRTDYANANAASATKLAPTGYAKVRIDCETPGAVLKFNVDTSATRNGATAGTKTHPEAGHVVQNGSGISKYFDGSQYSEIQNRNVAQLEGTTPTQSYSQTEWIFIGDGQYTSARKDYVSAKATAPNVASGMQESSLGHEGVFKTVVNYKGHASQIQIQGGTFNGGMPSIPGFPLRDAVKGTESQRYNQNTYYANDAGQNHYWVTYDIISEFSILSVHEEVGWSIFYSYGEYGQVSTLQDIKHY